MALGLLSARVHADGGIQDNSFLVEEAYNQDPGVVQHISTFTRPFDGGAWAYSLTEEWPAKGRRHQLSYTVPVLDAGSGAGLGDVFLNYRYQLVGDGNAKLAVAPRLSVSLPSGNEHRGRGLGAPGLQFSLPLSRTLGEHFIAHSNLGFTATPSARDVAGDEANLYWWNAGQSIIWLASSRFNVLLEAVVARTTTVIGPHALAQRYSGLLSPGIRWAYNFRSGLQIVPGIAFPIGFVHSSDSGFLLYLSFEHPFKRVP